MILWLTIAQENRSVAAAECDELRMMNDGYLDGHFHSSFVIRHSSFLSPSPKGVLGLMAMMLLAAACGHKAKVQPPKATTTAASTSAPGPPTAPSKAPASKTRPAPPGPETNPETKPTPASKPVSAALPAPFNLSDSPPIRIGLDTSAREVRISSSSEFYLLERIPEATRQSIQGDVQVRVERETRESATKYRIQVASFSKPEAAEELRRKLADKTSILVVVNKSRETGKHQVRVGEFATREEAHLYAAGILRRLGFRDYLIVKEDIAAGSGELTLAMRGPEGLFRVNKTGFLFFPASTANLLRLDGKPYRGFFELSLNKSGRMTVVNQLAVEEYLLGVVPAEFSPDSYPEFAALAAQSIAARTYALKNVGRFRSEGFDLTADVRTQVYPGAAGEKDLTTEAVRRTFGLAVYYQNQLIDAMYSSTCGGRTEDYSNVFDGPPIPYLKGVVCAAEAGFEQEVKVSLKGTHNLDKPVYSDDGSVANRSLELAYVLGLGRLNSLTETYLTDPPSREETLKWIEQARRIAGKSSGEILPGGRDLGTRADFLRVAAESLFGAREIERRISSADADYYLANLKDGDSVPQPARKAIAYLMQQNLWRSDPENQVRPNESLRRADALSLLLRWIESVNPQILRRGLFMGQADSGGAAPRISIKSGAKTQQFPLASDVHLFLMIKGGSAPADDIKMIGNEKVAFHLADNGHIDFLDVELNPSGTSSDRFSPIATWDVALTKSALAQKLRPLTNGIGEFRDLKPWKLGTSGRAVQIQIIGSRRSVVVNGYKVRGALGLRDTLYTISRAVTAAGNIESFTFHGRGWGHGVGMCQVGAFGMARAGRSYEEILKSYYQGVEIRKAY
jgi:stage II sporulation protein D